MLGTFQAGGFTLNCGAFTLRLSERTHVMGILNITPDSFFDGGRFLKKELALEHALQMEEQGADILDIGGESTRPGADPVDSEEEIKRVLPVIEAIGPRVQIPLSVDTRKSRVAEAALKAGAHIVNDVSGLKHDPRMAEVVARYGVPLVLMHMRGQPKDMQSRTEYGDLIGDVTRFFKEQVGTAASAGIPRERIVLDPGIGFGKKGEDNFVLIRHLRCFNSMGCPILVGLSRKSFIGKTLDLPESERLTGTIAAVTAAVLFGAHIIRVHDVLEAVQAAAIADRVKRAGVQPISGSHEH
jgi:dihydropteroate synthase